jgi:adenylate kinase family enzyme
MKIFVIGMPESGRTTVAKELCQLKNHLYIDASSWTKSTFRDQLPNEHDQQYQDELHYWINNRIKLDPNLIISNVNNSINGYNWESKSSDLVFVIDGISSPRDFISLFDFNKDLVVFLNRTGNQSEYKDYESIGVSVMRDYCFWLASADLISKENWHEYNFSIPGEDSDWIKPLGHKNSVFIVKSINRVISHLKEKLFNLQAPQS